MDDLTVRIERHPDLVGRGLPGRDRRARRAHQGATSGRRVAVRLEEPGALPRSEGKYKRVYDLRDAVSGCRDARCQTEADV